MYIDPLIDAFVKRINSSPREPQPEYELTLSVTNGTAVDGIQDWQVRRWNDIDWIVPLEAKLPMPLPASFRSFITRYIFPHFEIEPLEFLANTPEGSLREMRASLAGDSYLSKAGYLHFARPAGGSSDHICFDTHRATQHHEYPIVCIDHEGILCHDEIIIVEEVAPSFRDFVIQYLNGE